MNKYLQIFMVILFIQLSAVLITGMGIFPMYQPFTTNADLEGEGIREVSISALEQYDNETGEIESQLYNGVEKSLAHKINTFEGNYSNEGVGSLVSDKLAGGTDFIWATYIFTNVFLDGTIYFQNTIEKTFFHVHCTETDPCSEDDLIVKKIVSVFVIGEIILLILAWIQLVSGRTVEGTK